MFKGKGDARILECIGVMVSYALKFSQYRRCLPQQRDWVIPIKKECIIKPALRQGKTEIKVGRPLMIGKEKAFCAVLTIFIELPVRNVILK